MLDALKARLFLLLQYLVPRHLMTAAIYRIARIRAKSIKDFFIKSFVKAYGVDVAEAAETVPDAYQTFNAFFTRELVSGARTIDSNADSIVAPSDGTISAIGAIREQELLQAKGLGYTLADFLASDLEDARTYANGSFATIYLAPYNYHRVHCPVDAKLRAARHVPGDLFSVNSATVSLLPSLFARNERLILHFDTGNGPAMLVFVGALNVGSITTPWTGEIRPARRGVVDDLTLRFDETPADLAKGDLLGWFNMGSTVVMLFPPGVASWSQSLGPGATVRMGEAVGSIRRNAAGDTG